MNIGLWGFPVAGVAFSLAGVLLPGRLGRVPGAGVVERPASAPSKPRSLSEYRVSRRGVDAEAVRTGAPQANAAIAVAAVEHEPLVPTAGDGDVVTVTPVRGEAPRVAIATQLRRILRFGHRPSVSPDHVVADRDELFEDGVVGEVEVLPARTEPDTIASAEPPAENDTAAFVAPGTHLEPPAVPPMMVATATQAVAVEAHVALPAPTTVPMAAVAKSVTPRRRIGWFGRPSRPAIVEDESDNEATSTAVAVAGGPRAEMTERSVGDKEATPGPLSSTFVLGMAWEGAPLAVDEDERVLVDADAIARADARLAEFAETTIVVERPVSVVIPAWVGDYEAAGVDVSETGRVALAERLGLLEDEDAIVELRRVLMTETAPVVRGVALLTVGERAFASMSDAVVSAMEMGDAYERCAAITALAALGDVASLRAALADEDDGVVRMTVTLLLQTWDAEEVRAMIAERAGRHSEVALATVDSLI